MKLQPQENLTEQEIHDKLNLVVKDGLASEAMAVLSGGAFLVAFALKLGATNFQIGILASIGTLASILQLVGIYLIQKYRNRRGIVVITSLIARTSLVGIACLPLLFAAGVSLQLIILFLFVHHTMGSISGLCWNSWMKDLVPSKSLGTFFGQRSQAIQALSIFMNFTVALSLDYVKSHYPEHEVTAYTCMFLIAAAIGFYGVYLLALTPEPKVVITEQNIFKLFFIPFKNLNFKNLMIFHALWVFAINLASPFFTVYLLKTLKYPLSYVIALSIISQITNILCITIWGKFTDKYSNKSILHICAPIYLLCILGWTFTTMPEKHFFTIPLLILIHLFSGMSVSGINLALGNIGLKLAPKGDGVFYLSARSMLNALVGGVAPIIGGLFADFFAKRELSLDLQWKTPTGGYIFHTIDLQEWDFFFALAFILGIFSLYRLGYVKEEGHVKEKVIVADLLREFKTLSTVDGLRSMIFIPFAFFSVVRKRIHKTENEIQHSNHPSSTNKKAPPSVTYSTSTSTHSASKELPQEK